MGIDALDIVFRLEKSFGIKVPRGRLFWTDEQRRRGEDPPGDVSVGEIHERLSGLMREQNLPVPGDSWERVRDCVAGALGVRPEEVRREHRIVRDLGAT